MAKRALMPYDYDVIVIGAGIHGAGVAQAVAAKGHSVLVLEQTGIASGTSSRSSKLIHGGLRYLESAQFALVRECLRERQLLCQLAPELIRMVPFYVPIYHQSQRRPWQMHVGLSLYRWLSGQWEGRYHTVPKTDWQQMDGLYTEGLDRVFCYQDAQTDDAALTRAVLQSACDLGGEYRLPARFIGAELVHKGCEVRFSEGDRERSCQTRVLINAAGPAVNQVLRHVTPRQQGIAIELVQGSHIILDRTFHCGCYYLESPHDQRAIFVMPWQGKRLLIGTTEVTMQEGSRPEPSMQEIAYLQETASHYFPDLGPYPVVDAFAGLRVLPAEQKRAFSRSRETQLLTDRNTRPRLLSIYGGKLTAYRLTAEKVMASISPSLTERQPVADTRTTHLSPATSTRRPAQYPARKQM